MSSNTFSRKSARELVSLKWHDDVLISRSGAGSCVHIIFSQMVMVLLDANRLGGLRALMRADGKTCATALTTTSSESRPSLMQTISDRCVESLCLCSGTNGNGGVTSKSIACAARARGFTTAEHITCDITASETYIIVARVFYNQKVHL